LKQKQLNVNDWENISTNETYKLSIAEFKGMTIQALQDIRNDIKDIKQEHSITRYISMGIAGISGIVAGIIGGKIKF